MAHLKKPVPVVIPKRKKKKPIGRSKATQDLIDRLEERRKKNKKK